MRYRARMPRAGITVKLIVAKIDMSMFKSFFVIPAATISLLLMQE